jgi:hypothetical protein
MEPEDELEEKEPEEEEPEEEEPEEEEPEEEEPGGGGYGTERNVTEGCPGC